MRFWIFPLQKRIAAMPYLRVYIYASICESVYLSDSSWSGIIEAQVTVFDALNMPHSMTKSTKFLNDCIAKIAKKKLADI